MRARWATLIVVLAKQKRDALRDCPFGIDTGRRLESGLPLGVAANLAPPESPDLLVRAADCIEHASIAAADQEPA